MLPIDLAVALAAIALLAGVGISAVGPGGIFVTIALFVLAPISSSAVAGTASATFIATGLLATALYYRSGEFAQGFAREVAIILSGASVAGAVAGSRANFLVPDWLFGHLLAAFVAAVGVVIVYREAVGLEPSGWLDGLPDRARRGVLAGVGLGVGFLGGLLGVGGPVVAVPILVLVGVPMLVAVAVAQVQSVFISGFATIGYALGGAVSIPLALIVGVPQLVGVVIGWRVAHLIAADRLRIGLGAVLVLVAPALAL